MTIHEGGCLCAAVRYRVQGEPARASVCSCTACQRRTGSLAGFGAYFKEDEVRILRGALKSYEHRSDESGRWLRFEFCPRCGTQQRFARGTSKCAECGLRVIVEFEEPRCACGYLLYKLTGEVCPECGRKLGDSASSAIAAPQGTVFREEGQPTSC